jgi:hypothetical protein
MIRSVLPPLVAFAATLALPAAASAAPVGAAVKPKARAALVFPVTVIRKNDMDFGYLASTTAGTAVINPNSGVLTTAGGVIAIGGAPMPATFIGAAQSSAVVNIRLPNQPLTIVRAGGTQTMIVRDFTIQGSDKRTLARLQSFEFNVGATLVVGANQAEGLYTGTFDITVQYP